MCTADGKTILEYYDLDGVPAWRFVGFTALFFIFFYVATLLVLTFKKYQMR